MKSLGHRSYYANTLEGGGGGGGGPAEKQRGEAESEKRSEKCADVKP